MDKHPDFLADTLGKCPIPSPLKLDHLPDNGSYDYVKDNERILLNIRLSDFEEFKRWKGMPPSFEMAGARSHIYFDPSKTRAAMVTCGGLCPGINDVIRAVVMALHYRYGVRTIYGIRYGYHGFLPEDGHEPIM